MGYEWQSMEPGAGGSIWGMSSEANQQNQSGPAMYSAPMDSSSLTTGGGEGSTSAASQGAVVSLFGDRFGTPQGPAEKGQGAERVGQGSAEKATQGQDTASSSKKHDPLRSLIDHGASNLIHETALRATYHAGERAIAEEARLLLEAKTNTVGAEKAAEEVARWATQARNSLREAIRQQGAPIVDAVARMARGNTDMPTYERLRAAGKTDAQIIESAARSNASMNRWVGRLRIAGRIMIFIDIGIAGYKIGSAPEVDRPKVFMHETSRLLGALAGGWAGAKGGAALGGAIGSLIPGAGTAIGAGVGGVLGGIGGAIFGGWGASKVADWGTDKALAAGADKALDWVIDQFYPPDMTYFERSN